MSAPISDPGPARVVGLFAGRIATPWPGRPPSAIAKQPVAGPARVTKSGIAGDEQADRSVHGGPEMALHHYAADHHPAWAADLPDLAPRFAPGGFGENIATTGLTEHDLCIGDVLEIGQTLLQVSQGRQPCWKLVAHVGHEAMAYLFQKTGRTGWYHRVLREGEIAVGDPVRLIERPNPGWTVARVTRARLAVRVDPAEAAALADLPHLTEGWRTAFRDAASGAAEAAGG